MRFWLDRGVDGFRIDVAHGMAKPDGLPDMVPMEDTGLLADHGPGDLRFDQDGVHACTAGSGRCSTSTRAGWPSARSGCPTTRGWRSTCGPTSCSSPSTSSC